MSACEVAALFKLTKAGAETIIRKAGVGGLQWCKIHKTLETL